MHFPILIIADELRQFVQQLRIKFNPLSAITIIHLFEQFPTSLWMEPEELFGFLLEIAANFRR
jgi:hypothetical protein